MNNTGILPRLRGAAIFLLVCLLFQGGLYLLFSEPFAAWVYTAAARLCAEQIKLDDDSVLEYHSMRADIGGADLLVVGCNSGAAGTSELILDLLTFIKRCANVRCLALDLPEYEVGQLNDYLSSGDVPPEEVLMGCDGVTEETLKLIVGIDELNRLLPPARQIALLSTERSWAQQGEAGMPVLYLADRLLGAEEVGAIKRHYASRSAMVTIDLCYQASAALTDDGRTSLLNEINLPLAGEPGRIWLFARERLTLPADFYTFVVTRTRGGRLADLADTLPAQGGDYNLVVVGARESASLG